MCLYTKQTEPEVAEEDIICYKFYMIYNHGVLFSPYQGFRAPEIGVITNTELGKPYNPEESNFYIHNFYDFKGIDKGFHSFKTLEDTKSIVDGYKEHFVLVIYKCIIPKGSLYYSGKFRKYESYCSNNIKLIEVCV